jgi:hypothetical protein
VNVIVHYAEVVDHERVLLSGALYDLDEHLFDSVRLENELTAIGARDNVIGRAVYNDTWFSHTP